MLRLANGVASQSESRRRPSPWSWWLTGLMCGGLLLSAGCSRSFWRQNADDNAYAILQDKSADPRWEPPRLDLQPDARSRFFDPYDPDCEPLPPDDPTAHAYMHWMGRNTGIAKVDQPWTGGVLPPWLYPQKPIRGWKSWHRFGDTLTVENPQWLEPFGLTAEQIEEQKDSGAPEGPGLPNLTLAQAIELSYIHSRDFQTQLENLYSTALDLTFERFRFDVRYLGLGGREPSAGLTQTQVNNDTSSELSTRLGVSKLLPTGGQWIVEMANNTLWLFTGGNQSSTATTLSYSLVQPLLLGAGRQVVLESLTQSERNALYAMRDFARFRHVFFVSTVAGGTSGGGFYGLLQQYQSILNARYNIKLLTLNAVRQQALSKEQSEELKETLDPVPEGFMLPVLPPKYSDRLSYETELKELRWKGPMTTEELAELKALIPIPAVQDALEELYAIAAAGNTLSLSVAQLMTSLASSRSNLLSNERQFQDALDRYKFQLGLPPDLWVTLDVQQLRPFQLISPELLQLEEAVTQFVGRMETLPENQPVSKELQTVTVELAGLNRQVIDQGLRLLDTDWEAVQKNKDNRLANLPPTPDFGEDYQQSILDDYERDQRLIGIVRQELNRLAKRLEVLKVELSRRAAPKPKPPSKPEQKPAPKPGEKPDDKPTGKKEVEQEEPIDPFKELADIRESLVKVIQNMEVVQINLRVELISLNQFEMSIEQVVQTGLENRVDLMNQRAFVMDARRQVEVAANALRSQLDVTAAGDISTQPLGAGNTAPFEFRKDQSSFRLGVAFTSPLDQVQQRNNYRQTLINYQQARRGYMQAEDQVKLEIRNAWRQLTVLRQQFEITRKNVRLAAMQYDQAVEASLAPVGGAGGGGGGGSSSSQSGLNLLQALNSVLNAQNSLIQFWVNYEVNRLNIHRDMGIMQLDERGVWLDDYYQQQFETLPVTTVEELRTEGMNVPDVAPNTQPPSLPPLTPAMP